MKLAISVSGSDLDAPVDMRFGRAAGFLIVDPESLNFEHISNPFISAAGGAGIRTAEMIAKEGVEAVVTGNVGPNAYRVLESAGIKVFTGASGSAREAIESYKDGELTSATRPTVGEYFGMGGRGGGAGPYGRGVWVGPGMGRGRGGGGMGRCGRGGRW